MPEPVRVSASQVARARGCLRRWAWERVEPIPPQAEHTARLELGKAVHAVAEAYRLHGAKPDRATQAGSVFMPALPYVPPPGVGQAELEIRLDDPATLGYVDLLAPARDMPGEWPGCEHVILDYKTKNAFKSRGMFQGLGDFLTDPQALVYAAWYFRAHSVSRVGLRWLYLRVQGRPAAQACDAIVTREQALEAYSRIVEPVSRTLIALRVKPLEPLTLEPNPLECTRYGARYACPYVSRCGLTPSQKLAGALNMGLVDDLRAQYGNKGVNPPETKTPPAAQEPAQAKAEAKKEETAEQYHTRMDESVPGGVLQKDSGLFVRALRNACAAFVTTVDTGR